MHPMPRASATNQFTQPKAPVAVASVTVVCRDHDAHVEVKQDLFGIGQLINPTDLTLGTCAASSVDTVAQVVIFEPELQDCGSSLSMTSDTLIYTFTVNYNPQPLSNAPVLRTSKTAVIVECHYPRLHNVSSLPLDPLWSPFSAVKVAGEYLYFNLTLMTDDWQNVRPSYQYFLGDMINIQASVEQYYHIPLRVYVDNCVATVSPDTSSSPSYVFIVNGCLLDGRLTGSTSKFNQRTADNILQFQLEAFRFQDATSGILYITCHLIATSATNSVDSNHRACSYTNGVWSEASGANSVCSSFGSSGPPYGTSSGSSGTKHGFQHITPYGRKTRDVSESEIFEWEADVCLGPFQIEDMLIK
ncbi:hypothetical protein Q5P01_012361 [Channa striata]|uniref:Zona pellucida sperm-binding protein 3 n=1 Tax=Channa striata TaxID=64152 RepID=A0AA88MRR9_CHASR|nr:hypothetical protein Q5P01_012361 [Channa striata]